MDKPAIARQIDAFREDNYRLHRGEYAGIIGLGPHGVGKSLIVREVAAVCGVVLIPIPDATKFGIEAAFRAHPSGTFWLDDFDRWLYDLAIINLFKSVLDEAGARLVGSINRDTLRAGQGLVGVNPRIIITSNANPDSVPVKLCAHVAALGDRAKRRDISRHPADVLAYIDWMIVEQQYFRSRQFLTLHGLADRQMSLRQINDVLRFIHQHAESLRLSLREVDRIAMERVRYPDTWETALLADLQPRTIWPVSPCPQPVIMPGNSDAPRGRKAKQDAARTGGQSSTSPVPVAIEPVPELDDDLNPASVAGRAASDRVEDTTPDVPPTIAQAVKLLAGYGLDTNKNWRSTELNTWCARALAHRRVSDAEVQTFKDAFLALRAHCVIAETNQAGTNKEQPTHPLE